jgi:hypothetical protein
MLLVSVFIVSLILLFVNALFYTVSLLVLSFSVLIWMVSSNYIRTLIMILIVVVYVGAMIILIGYICAVSPNMVILPSLNYIWLAFFSLLFTYFINNFITSGFEIKQDTLLDFFLSDWGSLVFILIVFMLFFTLLIVTSQYIVPQGPFRSI